MAVVNFLDAERQWFKAAVGVPMRETPRAVAFCDHALRNPHQPTVVEDATRHPIFATYPSVVGEPHIRFYACIPLVTDEGHALGTLAVMDTRCRGLAAEELQALQMLARQTMDQLELRRQKLQLSMALQEREQMRAALQAQNNVLQAAGRVARLGGWVMELPSRAFTLSSGIASTFGMRRAEESTSDDRPATYALDEVLKAFQPPFTNGCSRPLLTAYKPGATWMRWPRCRCRMDSGCGCAPAAMPCAMKRAGSCGSKARSRTSLRSTRPKCRPSATHSTTPSCCRCSSKSRRWTWRCPTPCGWWPTVQKQTGARGAMIELLEAEQLVAKASVGDMVRPEGNLLSVHDSIL